MNLFGTGLKASIALALAIFCCGCESSSPEWKYFVKIWARLKCTDHIFTFRNVKDQEKLFDLVSSFCSSKGFVFMGESAEYPWEDYLGPDKDSEFFEEKNIKFKFFRFYHKEMDVACLYRPDMYQLKFVDDIHESKIAKKKKYLALLDDFCESLEKNGFDFRLETLEYDRLIGGKVNIQSCDYGEVSPESAPREFSYHLIKP